MAPQSKTFLKIRHYQKYLGLFLILLGIPTMIFDKSSGAEIPLLVGLFILLVATDRNQDERSVHLKTTSLYVAFILSYAVKLLTANFYDHAWISFELVEINHFMILVIALANVIYFFRLYWPGMAKS
jgi:hypothetical protein